ncbi:hypothetical protein GS501_07480 [Saccharibacter sp. 17.LH.SD]|uniref:hypothetical protein n=1 Tax=Saccharibacter sp. 17.LH.SD TaxID=2689393 RepID=UPI0013713091|nr:hypothetical protein [Saccharibacter sp. 17.LH.SD]MXV44879.1 hypothetical protein [Saccharibacter sp. 17.LH.SD]
MRLAGVVALLTGGFHGLSAWAAECHYDVSPLPVTTGEVTRITGDGVLLEDGTSIVLPESLLPFVRLSQTVTVRGLNGLHEKKVWAVALETPKGRLCPSEHDVKKGPYPGSPAYDVIRHSGEHSE